MAHRDYIYTVVVYCTSSAYILCVQILYEPANIFRLPETVYKTFININLFTVNITFQCFFQIFLIYAMVFYITIKNFIMRICKIISYIMRYFAQLSYICRRNPFVIMCIYCKLLNKIRNHIKCFFHVMFRSYK